LLAVEVALEENKLPGLKPWIPWIWAVLLVYLAFGVLIWIAEPLFNLLLRLDRTGSLALSQEQRSASNWVGVCLLGVLAGGLFALAKMSLDVLLIAGVCGLLIIPVARTFDCRPGWPRRVMVGYTLFLAVLGMIGVATMLCAGYWRAGGEGILEVRRIGWWIVGAFVVGTFLSGWLALYLIMSRSRH
jgi:hypothetical protein